MLAVAGRGAAEADEAPTAASWRDSIAIPITSVYARFAIADSIIRSTSSTRRPSIATSASTSPPRSAFTARS